MYAAGVAELEQIMARAAFEEVDFVIHAGDLCNDYLRSPELINSYLRNKYGLSVYGIYGNHELESEGNSMDVVTPLLSNRQVDFGGENVGYCFTDIKEYRIIGLDTNYSYSDELGRWEHNKTAGWGAPFSNRLAGSLAPRQIEWLDAVLKDAAERKIRC